MVKDSQKRSKHIPSEGTRRAKLAAKKKKTRGLKYRNADLRAALDSQTQEIFAVSILNFPSLYQLLMV